MPTVTISETVARGQDWTIPLTLEGSGSIAGNTYSAKIRRRAGRAVLLTLTPTITDAASRAISIALTDADTLKLEGDPLDPTVEVEHVLDVYQTDGSGNITVYGPLVFRARTPA
jgi:hypothetical protein